MYLVDTQPLVDLFGRNQDRSVFDWLKEFEPAQNELFISVLSLGQIAYSVEEMEPSERNHWRRLLQVGRRAFEQAGTIVDVDVSIVDVWQTDLRAQHLIDIEGADENFGEDDRLIIATAIARGYALVTEGSKALDEIAGRTTLTLAIL